jgi:hypothetical protein
MSSNQRDAGETLGSIAKRIPADVEGLSTDEMKSLLLTIKGDAEDEFGNYSYFMGWSNSKAEAITNLYEIEDQEDSENNRENALGTISLFTVTDWFGRQKRIPSTFEAIVYSESKKAWETSYGWVPKSQIVLKLDAEWHETPPDACIQWFEEQLAVGDRVRFNLRNIDSENSIDGIITKIDSPELYVNDLGYMMGDIGTMTKFRK